MHNLELLDNLLNQRELDFKGIKFPVGHGQVREFWKRNNLSLNVNFLKKKRTTYSVSPMHLTEHKASHKNLLLVESQYTDENQGERLLMTLILLTNSTMFGLRIYPDL